MILFIELKRSFCFDFKLDFGFGVFGRVFYCLDFINMCLFSLIFLNFSLLNKDWFIGELVENYLYFFLSKLVVFKIFLM